MPERLRAGGLSGCDSATVSPPERGRCERPAGHFVPALGRECICPSTFTTGAPPDVMWRADVRLAGNSEPSKRVLRGNPQKCDFGLILANVYRGRGGVFWEVRDCY